MTRLLNSIVYRYFAEIKPTGLPDPKVEVTLAAVLKIVFMVAALLAVVFVTIGGLKYTLSNGDPQGTAKAKNTIISAVIGLILALFAFTVVGFVAGSL